jgi:hypothetical protein
MQWRLADLTLRRQLLSVFRVRVKRQLELDVVTTQEKIAFTNALWPRAGVRAGGPRFESQ